MIRSLSYRPSLYRSSFLRNLSTSPALSIIDDCQKLRQSIQSLNDNIHGPLEKSNQKNTILPFVFLLGNHSSGKSSFINYLLRRKVQTAGVAPTDDSFTIIVPGASDLDRDGPAFIGDPDMGFSGLRTFGPTLMQHTQLKVRSDVMVKDFMLIDSPGMIDSPAVKTSLGMNGPVMDRGYDFEGVVKWFASRADVILLFFDPDKPGTTGETLSILTNSLVGMEHKLHIILNKADQFRKIHDFARAYGSLCWNLSKVIQRKDLPRIYTMCLPPDYRTRASGDRMESSQTQEPTSTQAISETEGEGASLGRGLLDLERSREEVVQEVLNAPKRRIDNEITRLNDSLQLLHMYCNILDSLIASYRSTQLRKNLTLTATSLMATGITATSVFFSLPIEAIAGTVCLGSLSNIGLFLYHRSTLKQEAEKLISAENLDFTFKRLYSRRLAERDEFISSLWLRVRAHIQTGLYGQDLQSMKRLKSNETAEVSRILEHEVPNLRRKVAPLLSNLKL